MKNYLKVLGFLICTSLGFVLPSSGQKKTLAPTPSCSGDRWQVKTLTDPTITEVNFGRIHKVTIRQLALSGTPAEMPETGRIPGIEWAVLKVEAFFVENLGVQPDGDTHVNLRNESGSRILVIEFPHIDCIRNSNPVHKAQMTTALRDLKRLCDTTAACVNKKVEVVGVGFWDNDHVELHPVFSFKLIN
jgi:hypothetical protein